MNLIVFVTGSVAAPFAGLVERKHSNDVLSSQDIRFYLLPPRTSADGAVACDWLTGSTQAYRSWEYRGRGTTCCAPCRILGGRAQTSLIRHRHRPEHDVCTWQTFNEQGNKAKPPQLPNMFIYYISLSALNYVVKVVAFMISGRQTITYLWVVIIIYGHHRTFTLQATAPL